MVESSCCMGIYSQLHMKSPRYALTISPVESHLTAVTSTERSWRCNLHEKYHFVVYSHKKKTSWLL